MCNNKINWKQKLSSRKFWAFLAALAVSGMAAFKVDVTTSESVAAIISATGACVAYILAEAHVDSMRE